MVEPVRFCAYSHSHEKLPESDLDVGAGASNDTGPIRFGQTFLAEQYSHPWLYTRHTAPYYHLRTVLCILPPGMFCSDYTEDNKLPFKIK